MGNIITGKIVNSAGEGISADVFFYEITLNKLFTYQTINGEYSANLEAGYYFICATCTEDSPGYAHSLKTYFGNAASRTPFWQGIYNVFPKAQKTQIFKDTRLPDLEILSDGPEEPGSSCITVYVDIDLRLRNQVTHGNIRDVDVMIRKVPPNRSIHASTKKMVTKGTKELIEFKFLNLQPGFCAVWIDIHGKTLTSVRYCDLSTDDNKEFTAKITDQIDWIF